MSKLGLCAALACVLAHVGPVVTADEPTPERLEALVLQLGAPEFAQREEAMAALLAAGKAAGSVLLRHREHPDAEVRSRIAQLLEALEILAPEQEAALARALDELLADGREGREPAVRAALALGSAGRKALERALQIPADAVEVRALGPAWIEKGATWKGVLRVRNVGSRTILVPLRHLISPSQSVGSFIEERPALDASRGGSMHSGALGLIDTYDRGPVLADAHRIAPGEVYERPLGTVFGGVMSGGGVGHWSWSFGLKMRDVLGLDESDLWMGLVGPECQSVGFRVAVIPQDAPSAIGGATIAIRLTPGAPVGGGLPAEIEIVHAGTAPVRIDADWPRYTWVALASADGSTVDLRTAAALGDGLPAVEVRTPLDLAPGAVARRAIRLPPVAPGRYWLVCAYFNAGAPDEPRPAEAKPVDSQGYALGRMLSARVEVQVPAAEQAPGS